MKILALFLASLAAFASLDSSCATTQYEASNNAVGTPGGVRFLNEIGLSYSIEVMETASTLFWTMFGQKYESQRKNVSFISLTIQRMNGIVTNIKGNIYVSADYIASFTGDVKTEFTGIMYHEIAHVRQWDAYGEAPIGLLTGIADFFRLNAGYASQHWVLRGQGLRWDQGFDVTALFLDYCENMYPGFVANLNTMMESRYNSSFFQRFTGKTVDELWTDYKVQHGN